MTSKIPEGEVAHLLPYGAVQRLITAAASHSPIIIDAAITRVKCFHPELFQEEQYDEDQA
jgi:hypothetical protein